MSHKDATATTGSPDHAGAGAPEAEPTVSGAHRRCLEAVFRHPLAHDLEWRELVALIGHIGAVQQRSGDKVLFTVGGEHQLMHRPRHSNDLTTSEVMAVRHLLTRAGWSAKGAPTGEVAVRMMTPPALIAIVDHHEAQVWRVDANETADGSEPRVEAYDPRHILHHMVQKTHRLDQGKTSADDRLLLEAIAEALAAGGEIVVIGHGVGDANMADQATAYLARHHPETHARIVEEIVADLPGLTTTELLDLGRHALQHLRTRSF